MGKRIVLTGAPGCGKTSVVNALAKMGYYTIPEMARMIIEEGRCLPQNDFDGFEREIIRRQLEYESRLGAKRAYLDRGVGDIPGYYMNAKMEIPDDIQRIADNHRYDSIFLLELNPIIYKRDFVRRETFEEAQKLEGCLYRSYKMLQYDLLVVPPARSPEIRAEYILANS
ncbi:MAG TPA: AAA family ATPase [archaeon]|nr:AAA family ATPase [archaeon]